ncbi:hypothetical protein [Paraburkholderia terrae]
MNLTNWNDPMRGVAQAIKGSVRAICKPRAKLNPEESNPGTVEYEAIAMPKRTTTVLVLA